MIRLDYRNRTAADAARAVMARFDAMPPGERGEALLPDYPKSARMWLLEAGIRHGATHDPDGSWRIAFARGLSPTLASAHGFHHLTSRGDAIWACRRGRSVARFDGDDFHVAAMVAPLTVGSHLALDECGGQVVIADPEAGELVALRMDDLAVAHRWKVSGGPQLPLVTPDGIVCVTGAGTGTLAIIRPQAGGYVTQIVEVGPTPHDPALSSDGQHAFVPCMAAADLVKVRLSDGTIVGRCVVGDGPSHVRADHSRRRIYVANSWDGTLTALDEDGRLIATVESGRWAHALCLTPDGGQAWVANFLDDTVAVFDTASLRRIALLTTEAYPHGLDIAPDGTRAVVTGFAGDYARVFDVATLRVVSRVEIGRGGSHTTFIRGGRIAVTTCSVADHLARIDLQAGTAVGRCTAAA